MLFYQVKITQILFHWDFISAVTSTRLMSVDILVDLKDKDENRSFQPILWLPSSVEVDTIMLAGATRREKGNGVSEVE